MSNLFENNGATFSDCRKYRYALWRIWDKEKPLVMFIGLNPSTANETVSDPTIKSVVRIANNNGFGGVYMLNIFPKVTPYPKELTYENVIQNLEYLKKFGNEVAEVVFAWGNFEVANSSPVVEGLRKMFPNAKALSVNKNGSPKHPLYAKGDVKPIKYVYMSNDKTNHYDQQGV